MCVTSLSVSCQLLEWMQASTLHRLTNRNSLKSRVKNARNTEAHMYPHRLPVKKPCDLSTMKLLCQFLNEKSTPRDLAEMASRLIVKLLVIMFLDFVVLFKDGMQGKL